MNRPYRGIQVGTGGQGAAWCRSFLPPHVDNGLIEIVGAVDIDPEQLVHAQEGLGLDSADCFTDVDEAFTTLDADFCTVVVPPEYHEPVIDSAVANDLHILSEKPIADSLEAAIRIASKVERAGLKMGVTMSHRYRKDITTLRRRIRANEGGPLDYVAARLLCRYREYGSWASGTFRHEMDHPLLVDGAIHHLDFLTDLAGGRCERLFAETWLPEWAPFAGDTNALVTMFMENGTRVTFEGALSNATPLNCWGSEYIRAECRDATYIVGNGEIERHDGFSEHRPEGSGEPIPLDEQATWSNTWLVEQFVEWLDGGERMDTNVRDNLQSMALVEAAIQSSTRGEPVNVQELLAEAQSAVIS